jgi:hypothetical protein
MRATAVVLLLLLAACLYLPIAVGEAPPPFCATKLGEFPTHEITAPLFGTPLVSGPDGAAYVAYITPALATVVRRYDPPTGQWTPETVLAPQTGNDPYHTQPSLGIDAQGYVHAAANMHNTPWQYWVSATPHSVASMVFRGQAAGTGGSGIPDKVGCTGACQDTWYQNEPGIAAIPGNQVTYPHFGTTGDGTLFVAYRECLKCDASFHERQWSAGLAQYHLPTRTWSRVAGIRPWATEPGKLPVSLHLAGNHTGRLAVSWLWCNQYTEAQGSDSCYRQPNFVSYAESDDHGLSWHQIGGAALTMPVRVEASEVVAGSQWFDQAQAQGYWGGKYSLALDAAGTPWIVASPEQETSDKGIKRALIARKGGSWQAPQVLSYSPTLVYRDRLGRLIAVSSGMRIHVSTDQGATWTLWPLDLERGAFIVTHDRRWLQTTGNLRLYAHQKSAGFVAVWSLTFPDSGRCGP